MPMIRGALLLLLSVVAMALMPLVRAADPPAIAIRNVTVLPMTRTDSLPPTLVAAVRIEHATIVIVGDRIAAVGPSASIQIPPGARIIEGQGKYVVPGFIDMHTHLSKTRASAMGLFVANGVTTVRDLGGEYDELVRWRREV